MEKVMLEELNSCQIRDMYYIYLLFWLSRHCGWYVWGAPLHVPRPERKMMYVLAKPPAKHREGAVWPLSLVCGILLEEPLFALHRWLKCLRPSIHRTNPADEENLAAPSPSLLASPPTQCSSMSATLNCPFCLHAFTSSCIYWNMFLLPFSCASLLKEENVQRFTEAFSTPAG